jgi:hypothetical protein
VKLSAKLVTALAALALVVVAVAGLIGTGNDVRADVNATISLDKSWYTATGAVKVTVQDADRDTSTAATTNFTFTAAGGVTQFFDLDDNLADSNGDGVIDSSDFAIYDVGVSTSTRDIDFAVVQNNSPTGGVFIALIGTLTGGTDDLLTIAYDIDTIQQITTGVTISSTQDSTGIILTLTETSAGSGGEFAVTVTLAATTSTSTLKLANLDQDTITASFKDDSPVSGTSVTVTDSATVETTGPTVDVTGPADTLKTQKRKPTFTVQITDNESGVDQDTISFNIVSNVGGATGSGVGNFAADDITASGGIITAEFTPAANLLDSTDSPQQTIVSWNVTVSDIAGNAGQTDSDADTTGDQDNTLNLDRVAPNIVSATVGTVWDAVTKTFDDTADDPTSVVVVFDEDLDASTVSESDFLVAGITPVSAQVFSDAKNTVQLTLAGALDPDATPSVTVVSALGDSAGNTSSVDAATAVDSLAPTFTATLSVSLTKNTVDLTITSDEPIQGNVPVIQIHTPTGVGTSTVARSITGIKVTGTNTWEVEVDETDDLLADGDQAIEITGSDAAGNAGSLGGSDASATAAVTFEVDTALASPTFTPAGGATITNSSPFVQVQYAEAVTLTAATFATGSGTAVDILAALNASTADNKLFVLSPGSFPGDAAALTLAAHTITVSATDAADNDSDDDSAKFTIDERDDFSLALIAGWNLVSLPGVPADGSINAVITDSDVTTVITYDAASGSFQTSVRDAVSGQLTGSLKTLDGTQGIWVNTSSFDPIKVAIPSIPAATLPPTISVAVGWNLIGVIDVSGAIVDGAAVASADVYLNGVEVSKIYGYDALTGAFTSVIATDSVFVGDGLWVFATKAGTITP